MQSLVVYYSLTGNTRKVAERIAEACNADIEQIKDAKKRAGMWAMITSAFQARYKHSSEIQMTEKDPAQYAIVILGTPIWAWTMASPMRAYIDQHKREFRQVAFFCTEGSTGGAKAFEHMSEIVNKQPIATLELTAFDLKDGDDKDKVGQFVATIAGSAEPAAIEQAETTEP